MTFSQKIFELKNKICEILIPLIQSDYWLLEVPYHPNIGDTLIWQGEMDFLKNIPFKCKGMFALETFKFPEIKETDIILFNGGGNFGDLWTKHHDFKMEVVRRYPKNKFLFFPQTVYFEKRENLEACARFLSQYDVTICARDRVSYQTLCHHFKNKILLVPDMAFCMNMKKWQKTSYRAAEIPLILKRSDKELKASFALERCLQTVSPATVMDWPTMGAWNRIEYFKWQVLRVARKFRQLWMYDVYMRYIYRPYLIKAGIGILKSHTDIYTTRLHTCILSILLEKEKIFFFDNSYGKNKQFYDTWLMDCENVQMME